MAASFSRNFPESRMNVKLVRKTVYQAAIFSYELRRLFLLRTETLGNMHFVFKIFVPKYQVPRRNYTT